MHIARIRQGGGAQSNSKAPRPNRPSRARPPARAFTALYNSFSAGIRTKQLGSFVFSRPLGDFQCTSRAFARATDPIPKGHAMVINRNNWRLPAKPAAGNYRYMNFYKYFPVADVERLRLSLYEKLHPNHIFGRIYLAKEGINAQLFVPLSITNEMFFDLVAKLFPSASVSDLRVGPAMDPTDENAPFRELKIRVKPQIVADKLGAAVELDLAHTGKSVSPMEWHRKLSDPTHAQQSVVVDCRNYWESDIGRFEGAKQLAVDRFWETWDALDKELKGVTVDTPVYIYCTGGIRCEKVGAYLTQAKGFKAVNRLEGGINAYVEEVGRGSIKTEQSLFKGKNFVFDDRNLAGTNQQVTPDVLTQCHSCGSPSDSLVNCKNVGCGILHISCPPCNDKWDGCCSQECFDIYSSGRTKEFARDMGRAPRYLGLTKKQSSTKQVRMPAAGPSEGRASAAHSLVSPDLESYMRSLSTPHDSVLERLEAETAVLYPHVAHQLIGPVQGKFMQMLLRSIDAEKVLELGTFTGYSALTFASALPREGRVYTVDNNSHVLGVALKYFNDHPDGAKIRPLHSTAEVALQSTAKEHGPYDLIFVDADKKNYVKYYKLIMDGELLSKANKKATLVFDNTLWKGKVSTNPSEADLHTAAIQAFNNTVKSDSRVELVILPIGDGVTLITRK